MVNHQYWACFTGSLPEPYPLYPTLHLVIYINLQCVCPLYLLTWFIGWQIQIKSYKMVKYGKREENWCFYVLKRTTPYGGARCSVHVFPTPYCGASTELALKNVWALSGFFTIVRSKAVVPSIPYLVFGCEIYINVVSYSKCMLRCVCVRVCKLV